MINHLAQEEVNFGPLRGIGPLGLEGASAERSIGTFAIFLSSIIGVLTIIAIIWFTFQFLTSALSIIGSGGDKNNLEKARASITHAIIGLVVTISATFLIDLVGNIIGIPSILDLGKLINPLIQ